MENAISAVISNADYFVLLLFRVGGLVFSSPIFGRTLIPSQVKIGLTASLAFLFFEVFPATDIVYNTLIGFLFICASELLLGIALSYVTNMFFYLTYISGHMIDMQIGFGIVHVYDPQNNTQIPLLGNLLNIILLVVFFGVDGHHRLIKMVYLTIERLPVGSIGFNPQIGLAALEIFAQSFMLGIMVAMPIIASGIILEICLGMMIRTIPQINMFVVGVPIKIFVGMILLIVSLPVFMNFSERIFSDMFLAMETMFSTFA